MKRRITQLAALLLLAAATHAQTEVTAGLMRGKDYGVTYMLPKTEIRLAIVATRHTYTPGEFCKYAGQYLKLDGVSQQPSEHWTLDRIEASAVGVPDKDKAYFVRLKDKTVAPLMELTEDGIVRSINMPYSGQKDERQPSPTPAATQDTPDPRTFLTQEILMAGSRAKMAELVAGEIYSIRESRNALLRGEADNMPKDGAQLKLMLDNLERQEKALTEMFAGKSVGQTQTFTASLTPCEAKDSVALRFSERLGVVGSDNLAGEPVYVSITDLKTVDLPPADANDAKKRKPEGVAYNVPGKAAVEVTYRRRKWFDDELPVSQFGTTEYLSPVLFNKNSPTQVLFDTATGGLLKVDRGE